MFLKFATDICRVCLGPDAKVPLFGTSENVEKFRSASSLEIAEDDGLPTSLCDSCSERLFAAYEFRQQCVSSDLYLRSFIHSMNVKFASEVGSIQQNSQSNIENIPEDIAGTVHHEQSTEIATDNQPTGFSIKVIQENCPESVDQRSTEDDNEDSNEVITCNYTYINQLDKQHSDESDSKQEIVVNRSPPFHESHDETEDTQDTVQLHQNIMESFVCHLCHKPYSSRANLSRHILTHSNIKPFQCPVCRASFTQSGSLKQHMLRHTGEKPHKCTTCGKGFTRNRLLKMHERIHTGEKPYHCDECNLFFTVKEGLRRHNLRKHFGIQEQVYTCDICNKDLHSKYTFRNHMHLHRTLSAKSHGDKSSSNTMVTYVLDEQDDEKEESGAIA